MFGKARLPAAILCLSLLAPRPASANDLDACNKYEDSQTAIAACTRIISAGTFQPMFHIYSARGVAYRFSNNYDRAIADFDECLRQDAGDSICFGQRGIAYKLKGDRAQALADLQTAVTLDPSNQTAVDELAKLRSGR